MKKVLIGATAVVLAALCVVGLVAYVSGHQNRGPRTRLGVALDSAGTPTLVSAQCPGEGLRSARLVLDATNEAIWSANLGQGPAVTALPMDGTVSGYDVNGSIVHTANSTAVTLDEATGTSGRSLNESDLRFDRAALKRNWVLVGVAGDESLDFESFANFEPSDLWMLSRQVRASGLALRTQRDRDPSPRRLLRG